MSPNIRVMTGAGNAFIVGAFGAGDQLMLILNLRYWEPRLTCGSFVWNETQIIPKDKRIEWISFNRCDVGMPRNLYVGPSLHLAVEKSLGYGHAILYRTEVEDGKVINTDCYTVQQGRIMLYRKETWITRYAGRGKGNQNIYLPLTPEEIQG